MKQLAVSALVLDFDFYPRASIDSQHVYYLAEALRAGTQLPPLVIEKKSKRLIDGFHRARAYRRVYGDAHKVEVIEKEYPDEAALFIDCIVHNAAHGRNLSMFDRTHCLLKAETLHVDSALAAGALGITVTKAAELRAERTGQLTSNGATPLKRTIRHMAGREISAEQAEANAKLSGMNQQFYVNQLLLLLCNDLLNTADDDLMRQLTQLHGELDTFFDKRRKAS